MTAGFNSDIVLDGVVYHIQTEDKGPRSGEIVTQVFRDGAVVFTRRSPHPARGDQANSEAILEGLVRSQHMKLLQFVRTGGLRKKSLLEKALRGHHVEAGNPSMEEAVNHAESQSAADTAGQPAAEPALAADATQVFGSGALRSDILRAVAPQPLFADELPATNDEVPAAGLEGQESLSIDRFLQELAAQAPAETTAEEPNPPSAPAENRMPTVMIPVPEAAMVPESAEPPAGTPPLEEAPALPSFHPGEQCEIQLLTSVLNPGEIEPLRIRLRSNRQHLPIPHARVEVKVFGQTIRPLAYVGWSDGDGVFAVDLVIPHFTVGTGCVEITALTSLGSRTMRLDVACPSAAK